MNDEDDRDKKCPGLLDDFNKKKRRSSYFRKVLVH